MDTYSLPLQTVKLICYTDNISAWPGVTDTAARGDRCCPSRRHHSDRGLLLSVPSPGSWTVVLQRI